MLFESFHAIADTFDRMLTVRIGGNASDRFRDILQDIRESRLKGTAFAFIPVMVQDYTAKILYQSLGCFKIAVISLTASVINYDNRAQTRLFDIT
jgi:hypothetical protein